MTLGQVEQLRHAFDTFDADKSGSISYRELKVCMRALGFPAKKKEVLALLSEYDQDASGELEFTEFKEIMRDKMEAQDPAEELNKAFALFDMDASGAISFRDLRKLAKELGENIHDDELQGMIDEFDLDGDGEIDLAEFQAIMKDEGSFD